MDAPRRQLGYDVRVLHHGSWGWLPVAVRSDGKKRRARYQLNEERAWAAANTLVEEWRKEDGNP